VNGRACERERERESACVRAWKISPKTRTTSVHTRVRNYPFFHRKYSLFLLIYTKIALGASVDFFCVRTYLIDNNLLLLATSADANVVDASGWTPLHCCLMHGHVQTAAALVKKHKADYTMEVR